MASKLLFHHFEENWHRHIIGWSKGDVGAQGGSRERGDCQGADQSIIFRQSLHFDFHFAGQKCLAWKSVLGLLIENCDSILPMVEQLLEGGGRQEGATEGASDGVGFLVARTSQRFSGGRGHQSSKFSHWFVYQFDCAGTSASGLQTVNGESIWAGQAAGEESTSKIPVVIPVGTNPKGNKIIIEFPQFPNSFGWICCPSGRLSTYGISFYITRLFHNAFLGYNPLKGTPSNHTEGPVYISKYRNKYINKHPRTWGKDGAVAAPGRAEWLAEWLAQCRAELRAEMSWVDGLCW